MGEIFHFALMRRRRSARCSNDAAPLSRSVGSQDRVVARVRRGGHLRPRLAVFRPRYHSCHCRGRRCGRCRGNHQIAPLFRARTALGSTVAALIDNGASQPQNIRPGQAEPGRSGAVRSSSAHPPSPNPSEIGFFTADFRSAWFSVRGRCRERSCVCHSSSAPAGAFGPAR